MKKLFFVILPVSFLAAMVSSCDKTKDTDPAEKFSTLSVEANKATVETSGVDFVKVMRRMRSIEAGDVITNLGNILSSSSAKGFLFSKDSKLFSTLETFAAAAKGEKKLNDVFNAMVSPKGLNADPESIKEFWDSNVGTYTWDKNIEDWTIVLGGNKFIFLFPSSDLAVTNDATLTISNYTGIQISNPLDEDYTGDLPLSLNAELKKGSKSLITFVFGGTYNTDGVPNAIASDLTIENYKFEVDIANDKKIVSMNYKFLENSNVVLDLGASGAGLFTEANYDANTTTTTHTEDYGWYDYVWNPSPAPGHYDEIWVPNMYTWEETETDFEEILNSANAHFQLFNIALRGDINVKGLVDQLRLIDIDYNNNVINEETSDNRYASKINEFLNLRLVDVTKNEILAKADAYVAKETNYDYVDTYIDFKLTFKDGSKIDMETYTDTGFNNFINELNGLINDINADSDLNIDPIVY